MNKIFRGILIFNKKYVFALILLVLCVFGLTSVSASDLNETVISQIDDGASLEDAPELSVGKNNEPEILSVNYTPQNFSEIQTVVDNASDGTS